MARHSLEHALAERRAARIDGVRFELFAAAERFLTGQETALVSQINGGPPHPTFIPPRPTERGVRRRPTLIQNVETLAHLALIARHGPAWFRGARHRAPSPARRSSRCSAPSAVPACTRSSAARRCAR